MFFAELELELELVLRPSSSSSDGQKISASGGLSMYLYAVCGGWAVHSGSRTWAGDGLVGVGGHQHVSPEHPVDVPSPGRNPYHPGIGGKGLQSTEANHARQPGIPQVRFN